MNQIIDDLSIGIAPLQDAWGPADQLLLGIAGHRAEGRVAPPDEGAAVEVGVGDDHGVVPVLERGLQHRLAVEVQPGRFPPHHTSCQ